MELPQALLKSLEHVPGFDASSFLQAHHSAAPVSIRLNANKCKDPEQFLENSGLPAASRVPWCPTGYYLMERPKFTLDPSLHAGAYYVQEASSMFLHHLVDHLTKNENELSVLDLCAAPGGKSSLLSALPQVKLVVANEIIRSRVSILYENMVKWGDQKIIISNSDPVQCRKLGSYFDVMLVDAPCSGSGLFRKDPTAISEWSEENVKHCAERQKRILADALPALKEDGLLIYSTCSYSAEENENIMDWLMQHADLEPLEIPVPESWGIVKTMSESGGIGYRFFPGRLNGEGFFTCAFRYKGEEASAYPEEIEPSLLNVKEIASLDGWLRPDLESQYLSAGNDVYIIPDNIFGDYLRLNKTLNIRKAGVHAGSLAHGKFVPEHELALTDLLNISYRAIDLNLEQALLYLRKQVFTVETEEKGWFIVRYNGLKLGWIKQLGNRINNYYPASWRILLS